ncbi:hypothetical protein [Escherichia coli]|uniref:hypothetical protein n=1 Tax=Escherichia coli TaxID=562 RepID=UPI000BDED4AF|nr:hypothetical protein [Escherichia coli]HCP7514915.1 hypothetical protein [Escherichia coli]
MYDYYKHNDHLVRFNGVEWTDVTMTNKPKFTHQQLAASFEKWLSAQDDNKSFVLVGSYDINNPDDLDEVCKLINNFGKTVTAKGKEAHGNRYNRDEIVTAIKKGQSKAYITEKFKVSDRQYYRIKKRVSV